MKLRELSWATIESVGRPTDDAMIVLEALREYLRDNDIPVYKSEESAMQLTVSLPKRNFIVLRYWPPNEIWYGYSSGERPGYIKKITPSGKSFIGKEKIADPDSFARILETIQNAIAVAKERR